MNITNLTTHIRIGDHWPHVVDVNPINKHSDNGLTVGFYSPSAGDDDDRLCRVELRKKEERYQLFIFRWSDDDSLPDWWQDSELVWELKNGSQT